MMKRWLGLWAPFLALALFAAAVLAIAPRAEIKGGLLTGIALALLQSLGSAAALKWAWRRKTFYAVWGATVLFRFAFLGLTAWLIHAYFRELNLAATLVTMVLATTIFVVFESAVLSKGAHGFPAHT